MKLVFEFEITDLTENTTVLKAIMLNTIQEVVRTMPDGMCMSSALSDDEHSHVFTEGGEATSYADFDHALPTIRAYLTREEFDHEIKRNGEGTYSSAVINAATGETVRDAHDTSSETTH